MIVGRGEPWLPPYGLCSVEAQRVMLGLSAIGGASDQSVRAGRPLACCTRAGLGQCRPGPCGCGRLLRVICWVSWDVVVSAEVRGGKRKSLELPRMSVGWRAGPC